MSKGFNFTNSSSSIIGVPSYGIITAIQIGTNLHIKTTDKSSITIVSGLLSDLLIDGRFFPVNIGSYNMVVNSDRLKTWQVSSDLNKTTLYFKDEYNTQPLTVNHSISEVLGLINADNEVTSDELGGYVFTDDQYTESSPQQFLEDVPQAFSNNKAQTTNLAAPSYAIDWWGSNKIQPDNGNLDFYTARVDFIANPDAVNQYLVMQLDIGGSQGIIWENSIPLPRGANINNPLTISIDFFAGTTFEQNGGSINITSKINNCQLFNNRILIQKLRKVKV